MNKKRITFFRRFVFVVALFFTFSSEIFSGDIIVNVTPSPAKAGDNVRVSVITDDSYFSAVILLPTGKAETMLHVNNNLHRAKFDLPKSVSGTSYDFSIVLTPVKGKPVTIPYKLGLLTAALQGSFSLELDNATSPEENEKNELEQKLESLEERMDDLELEKQDLQKKLDELNKELDQNEKNNLTKEELDRKRKELDELEKALNDKNKSIQDTLKQLKQESESLSQKKIELEQRESQVVQKEAALKQLQNEIQAKHVELVDLKDSLDKKNEEFIVIASELEQEKKTVSKEKYELNELNKSVSKERQRLILLTQEMETKQVEYTQEQERLAAQKVKETDSLVRKQSELDELKKSYKLTQSLLKKSEKQQEKLNKSLETRLANLDVQEAEVSQQKQSIDAEKREIQKIENDLAVREEVMTSMKQWISTHLTDLQKNYEDSNKKNSDYLVQFDDRFAHLEDLTQLIEQRALKLEELNTKLKTKNKVLNSKLKGTYGNTFLFGFSPYLGVKDYSDNRYAIAKLAGLRLFTSVSNRISLQAVLAYQSTNQENLETTKYDSGFYPEAYCNYTFTPTEPYDIFGSIGISPDFITSSKLLLSPGIGLRFPLEEDRFLRIESHISNGFDITFGLEKIILRQQKTDHVEEPEEAVIEPMAITGSLSVPQNRKHIKILPSDADYFMNHWAYRSISNVASYGVIEVSKDTFKPSGTVTRLEATKMVVLAYYLNKFFEEEVSQISLEVMGAPTQTLRLDVVIKDKTGQIVKDIAHSNIAPGSFSYAWKGKNNEDAMVQDGTYYVEAVVKEPEIVFNKEKQVDVTYKTAMDLEERIKVASYFRPDFIKRDRQVYFLDIDRKSDWYDYVQESVYFGLFDYPSNVINKNSSVNFDPDYVMLRKDFIKIVSKILVLLGAPELKVNLDYSKYVDNKDISPDLIPYLNVYIVELGYGGDEKGRLRLNDPITKAEASVVIDRLIRWQVSKK